jgi:hypothetical protein
MQYLRKKNKKYCAKGICFALEMDTKTSRFLLGSIKPFRFFIPGLLCLCSTFSAMTQNDSSLLLLPEQLTDKNVKDFGEDNNREFIRSATRAEENPSDLPFTTWVITSEDILRYGFVTLADVLKAAPGIKVSQPGNAVEGETFMMRGLSGNQYMKILINDVPVKPSLALGMSIGAQLPIRAAERIEVLYGPAGGMMYGNDACAGVVNIITKETERPIFTRADLGFGKYGYNSLDLTFGGKLFKGHDIVRFSMYGSSTVRSQTDVFWDKEVLNIDNYLVNGLTRNDLNKFPNYKGEQDSVHYSLTSPADHESRLFGIQMRWRGVSFSYHRMSREDVSFAGTSPVAISYSATGNFHKDRLDTYALSCWKKTENIHLNSTWSMINYLVGNNSSASYIFDQVNQLSFSSQSGASLSETDKNALLTNDYFTYNSGSRFRYSRSVDLRWDACSRLRLWRKLWLTNGVQVDLGSGVPLMNRHYLPPQDRIFFPENGNYNGPFQSKNYTSLRANAYANVDWQGKKFRVMAGVGNSITYDLFTPRIAAIYHIDSASAVYVNVAQSFKQGHSYQRANTYRFDKGAQLIIVAHAYPGDIDPVEKVNAGELGYRRKKSQVSVFYQNAYNLVRDGYLIKDAVNSYTAGFNAAPGLAQNIWGVQTRLVSEALIPVSNKNNPDIEFRWRGEFFAQYSRGSEWFGYGLPSISDIRNNPRWFTQFRTSMGTGRLQITVASNRQTSILSKAVTYQDIWQRKVIREKYPTFRTWDAMFRFYLNKNFVLYFNLMNAFNKKSYGLDAFGSPDDALAPLQQRRLFRFGINYNMN